MMALFKVSHIYKILRFLHTKVTPFAQGVKIDENMGKLWLMEYSDTTYGVSRNLPT